MNRSIGHSARGFTLVELLVSLAILAMLMALVFGALRFAGTAWSKVGKRANGAAEMLAVRNLLQASIAHAYPGFASTDPADNELAFDGKSDSLIVLAPLPEAIEGGVGAQLRFFTAQQGAKRALYLGWRLDLPSSETAEPLPEERVMLLDNVRDVRFEYFGPSDATGAPSWQMSWSGRDSLPGLVRVHIDSDGATLLAWPDLVAGPQPTASPACAYDPTNVKCRRVQ